MSDSIDLDEEDKNTTAPRQRYPPQGQTFAGILENSKRQTQPSVSIEQAARPNFDITVGDPTKIGDLTSSHTIYQVRTKVRMDLVADRSSSGPTNSYRHLQRLINRQSSLLAAATVIFYGFTIRYTVVIQAS